MKNPRLPDQNVAYPLFVESSNVSLPFLKLTDLSRDKILEYFKNTWALTELLFSGLSQKKAFYIAPYHNLRHPLIFYYGHTAVCYVNKLRLAGITDNAINPYYEKIFEIGVDEMSWDDLSKNTMRWPEIEEVQDYRNTVYNLVISLIQTHDAFIHETITQHDPAWALMLAMEHERIHLETSSVLIRELPITLVSPPHHWPKLPIINNHQETNLPKSGVDFPDNAWISIPAKTIHLGKAQDISFYGWDNEYGNKKMAVKEFKTQQFLVTNGEFFQFVKSSGYHKPQYWSNDAGRWCHSKNVKHPTFWIPKGPDGLHQYDLRTCFEVIPMQWSWPAIVNFYEAKAYCAWVSDLHQKNFRLLTEAEYHCLEDFYLLQNSDKFPNLQRNIELRYGSEGSVDAFCRNDKGIYDISGNVWQWMEDHFCPLPGFETHPYYADFSTPCFDGAHHLIMGGSFISTGDVASPWARYHFRPHFFQHAGFRVVAAEHLETTCMDCPPPYIGTGPCCRQIFKK